MSRIGTAGFRYYGNFRTGPRWLADFSSRDHLIPAPAKLDPTVFRNKAGVQVRVASIAAQGATSITIDALTAGDVAVTLTTGNVIIPAGTTLDFGGAKFARLTANAVTGATTLTVAALPTALAVGDRANYSTVAGFKVIEGGLLVGRTIAERDAGTPYGVADVATPDDQIYLTLFDAESYGNDPVDIELVRHNAVIKENYLPDWSSYTTGMKAALRSRYRCITGVD